MIPKFDINKMTINFTKPEVFVVPPKPIRFNSDLPFDKRISLSELEHKFKSGNVETRRNIAAFLLSKDEVKTDFFDEFICKPSLPFYAEDWSYYKDSDPEIMDYRTAIESPNEYYLNPTATYTDIPIFTNQDGTTKRTDLAVYATDGSTGPTQVYRQTLETADTNIPIVHYLKDSNIPFDNAQMLYDSFFDDADERDLRWGWDFLSKGHALDAMFDDYNEFYSLNLNID